MKAIGWCFAAASLACGAALLVVPLLSRSDLLPVPATPVSDLFAAALAALAAALAAAALPGRRVAGLRVPPPAVAAVAAAAAFAAAAAASTLLFDRIPHVQDSAAQLFHARIFLHGAVAAPAPPGGAALQAEHVVLAQRWYSQYPPGHAALLALGLLARAEWLVDPLLGAAACLLLFLLGRALWDARTGALAAALGATSPFLVFMSSEYMNHPSALAALLAFAWLDARAARTGRTLTALAAGLALGFALTVRPYSSVAVALPLVLLAAFRAGGGARERLRLWLATGAGAAAGIAALLVFNARTTGAPLLFGYEALYGRALLPGFGHAPWGKPHTLAAGLAAQARNAACLDAYLFGWGFPSLLFASLVFLLGKADRRDVRLLLSAVGLAAFHVAYFFQDLCFGPRFLYETCLAFLPLTARGLLLAWDRASSAAAPRLRAAARAFVLAFVGWGAAHAAAVTVPGWASIYSRSYWGVDRRLLDLARSAASGPTLVLTPRFPSVAAYEPPFLDGPLVFAKDPGPRGRAELAALFPARRVLVDTGTILVDPRAPRARGAAGR